MRAYDCSHVRGVAGQRRRVEATALVQRPRRGVERLAPVPDGRLARLAAGDERTRTDLLLWAYGAAILAALVLIAVTALAGVPLGALLTVGMAGAALVAAVGTVLARDRFVVFVDDPGAPAAADGRRPGAAGTAGAVALGGLERCAAALAASAGGLAALGDQASPARVALADALAAARRRLDAAGEAEHALAALDTGTDDGAGAGADEVVAEAVAEARQLAEAHRQAAAEHLTAARDLLAAARGLLAARAAEHRRFDGREGGAGADRGAPGWGSVVADEDELATLARAEQAIEDLAVRTEALAALG